MSKYNTLKQEIFSKRDCPKLNQKDNKIRIEIKSTDEILSPYSENNRLTINSEFADFLENSVKDIPAKDAITIEIKSEDKDINKISKAIKNYYYNEAVDSERKLKSNLLFSITNLLIGIIIIVCNGIFQLYNFYFAIISAVDILAWVFIGEAFEIFLFERHEIKHNQHRQMNFINAKIIIK